jgi:replication factor C small subunit|tara:strand:+ start:12892 stop:13815 length:924 start_codon:yes stop_codon:yes gene_type:complete
MRDLWVEKYRPDNIGDYVFRDANQQGQVTGWIKDGALPHLLFSGAPGTGKTTLAKVLLKELDVDNMDILEINASNENSVDTIRSKITNFSSTMPFGDMKYVLLDEADYITPNGQAALRGVMETYHTSCRFILTCNYPQRIIPALHSRCQGFHINKLDINEFTARIATICIAEGVDCDLDTLDTYVQATYPDLRKAINLTQQNVVDGHLQRPQEGDGGSSDWMISAIELFKASKYKEARNMIVSQARPEEYEDIYRFMYRNLELWGDTDAKQDQAIIIIRNGIAKAIAVADPEINLSATLIELQLNSM